MFLLFNRKGGAFEVIFVLASFLRGHLCVQKGPIRKQVILDILFEVLYDVNADPRKCIDKDVFILMGLISSENLFQISVEV